MIQTLAISLAAALLFAVATGSANAQSRSTDLSPWTVTHGGNARSQKKPGAMKAQANKPKKEDKSALGNFAIQHGTSDLQNKKTKGVKSK
jgi:hypothetical protein